LHEHVSHLRDCHRLAEQERHRKLSKREKHAKNREKNERIRSDASRLQRKRELARLSAAKKRSLRAPRVPLSPEEVLERRRECTRKYMRASRARSKISRATKKENHGA